MLRAGLCVCGGSVSRFWLRSSGRSVVQRAVHTTDCQVQSTQHELLLSLTTAIHPFPGTPSLTTTTTTTITTYLLSSIYKQSGQIPASPSRSVAPDPIISTETGRNSWGPMFGVALLDLRHNLDAESL